MIYQHKVVWLVSQAIIHLRLYIGEEVGKGLGSDMVQGQGQGQARPCMGMPWLPVKAMVATCQLRTCPERTMDPTPDDPTRPDPTRLTRK